MSWFSRRREARELTDRERELLTTGLAGFCDHGVGMLDNCTECCPPPPSEPDVLLSDALAVAEGRALSANFDEKRVGEVQDAVRRAVSEVLGVEPVTALTADCRGCSYPCGCPELAVTR